MNKFRFRGKQAGGTLAGFIGGLVVGLGIAVVVAVMINKTPVPFMSKSKNEKADASAASSAPLGDPNKPLYGSKEAARDAARDFMKEASPNPTVEEGKLPAAKTDGKTDARAADATGKAGETKPAGAAAADDKWVYYLQVGAFKEQADAEGEKAKLALQGFEASIQERASETGTLYRVRMGPYTELDAMNRVRGKLSESGVDVSVVRVAK